MVMQLLVGERVTAGVDYASRSVLIEPSVHVLLKGLGAHRERSSQLTVPSKYSLACKPAEVLRGAEVLSMMLRKRGRGAECGADEEALR